MGAGSGGEVVEGFEEVGFALRVFALQQNRPTLQVEVQAAVVSIVAEGEFRYVHGVNLRMMSYE